MPRFGAKRRTIDAPTQRAFIAALAATGSVAQAAKATGFAKNSYYTLRRMERAESFSAAWDRAVAWGARRVLDTLMDHAIHGTPETIVLPGGGTIERRRYHVRAMQWIVAHNFPEDFGGSDGLSGTGGLSAKMRQLKAKWRAQWEAEQQPFIDEKVAEGVREAMAIWEDNNSEVTLTRKFRVTLDLMDERRARRAAGEDVEVLPEGWTWDEVGEQ